MHRNIDVGMVELNDDGSKEEKMSLIMLQNMDVYHLEL